MNNLRKTMNNFIKLAYDHGVRTALQEAGITKVSYGQLEVHRDSSEDIDFLNRPENIEGINQHLAQIAKERYGKSLTELGEQEWVDASMEAKARILNSRLSA